MAAWRGAVGGPGAAEAADGPGANWLLPSGAGRKVDGELGEGGGGGRWGREVGEGGGGGRWGREVGEGGGGGREADGC